MVIHTNLATYHMRTMKSNQSGDMDRLTVLYRKQSRKTFKSSVHDHPFVNKVSVNEKAETIS